MKLAWHKHASFHIRYLSIFDFQGNEPEILLIDGRTAFTGQTPVNTNITIKIVITEQIYLNFFIAL
jgi:hypothetical protein